jgi:hypothetical protein
MGIVVSTTSTGRVVVVTTAVFSTGVVPTPALVVVVCGFDVVVSGSTPTTGIEMLVPTKFEAAGDELFVALKSTVDNLEKNSIGIPE